ncbi:tetratricopeptide repeat protein [Luteolibacter marinus]|uniref:O-linked N-acetylglucosamine transferase family protein n=1 Tax=Luteolibacter marinus TaxID=2776705 RepID=UPI0018662EED
MASPQPHLRAGRKALDAGQAKRAILHFTRAIAADPRQAEALLGMARACRLEGRRIDALKALDRIIVTGQASAASWILTGDLLAELREWAQALDAYRHALAMDRGNPMVHHQLAAAAYRLGEADLAAGHLKEAAAGNPGSGSLASLASMIPGVPAASQQEILDVRRQLAKRLAEGSECAGRVRPGPYANPRPRVGYLSGHFNGENYMKPVWALLNHHDRSRFEVHLFSTAEDPSLGFAGYRPDPADRLHAVGSLSNAELAGFIAEQQIDLLVDLGAYSSVERLELFLSPVAPVVATWFNAFATSGMPGIDVIIGDDESVRPEEERFYSESVRRLPLSYLTFQVTHEVPPVAAPPCLVNRHLTFGSLVTGYKIVPEVLDAWCAILRGAPGSRLVLANSLLASRQNVHWWQQRFADRGIDPQRLDLLPPAGHREFLGYYDRIDVALDAFPYNGGTTTMEAIWQGVPVLTFDGDRWASRTSQTLLRRSHLAGFVAASVDGMIATATSLAADPGFPERLAVLRREMRDRLATAPVCDGAGLAAAMESLYADLLEGC